MLIQKSSVSTGDIVSFKLVNNDEIVARVVECTSTSYTVEKVVLLAISMDTATGRPAINMLPFWMMGGDPTSKITLQLSHIIAMVVAGKETKDSYLQLTTGLVLPNSNMTGLI